ncbi:PolC-type DNA polymerase III [Bifidobacterium callitrichidarum]|uniref:DNA polymerase III subunit epsilon n=1 Tax=Bifidobacterium callitrichidarum TaxID=2052941 RepID=A0A2U2N7L2_9BIFI|nr:3'-5' exonuclease [Bifidobacterium callitrichidarum]PWG65072.1 DNA polymerase III subunit epsilon [Bifidobacterium callitrichidarum]
MTTAGITVFGQPSDSARNAGEMPAVDATGFPADYVALDLETTGFYPNSCAITEIGAVRVREGRIVDQFQQLINPLRPIPRQITALTGISDAMVADLEPIDEVLPRFISWLGKPGAQPIPEPIIGHNVSFDLRFLDYNTRHIAGTGFACTDYDTMQISRTLFPEQRHHRLADLIVRFGIADNEEHRALSDAIQTQECFEWMRRYIAEHHESDRIDWRPVAAKSSTPILHQQLVIR